ncbi:hypothetical protein Ahy_B01g051995 [Arachis hypogaea]|uniref:Uncharacterized protein n=1 Tax=Arachis hypogaea TaxID=3818 RepID=A0A445ANI2_ARAHY|nr:hypothetical protein Ahy_B01g051995 [Arachis hypogaea]
MVLRLSAAAETATFHSPFKKPTGSRFGSTDRFLAGSPHLTESFFSAVHGSTGLTGRMAEWSKAPDSSSGLRERAWGRKVIENGMVWRVGDGGCNKIIGDPWLATLYTRIPSLYRVPSNGLRTGTLVTENRASAGSGVAVRWRKVAMAAQWKGRLILMVAAQWREGERADDGCWKE